MRYTDKFLQARVDVVNAMLGIENPAHDVPGSIELYHAYGGTGVHQVANTSHGVHDAMGGLGTKREAAHFLRGMIAALRITQGGTP